MTNRRDVEFHLEVLRERHETFKRALNKLIHTICGNNDEAKLSAAAAVQSAGKALQSSLSSTSQPDWLSTLISTSGEFVRTRGSNNLNNLQDAIIAFYTAARDFKWAFDSEDAGGIDFDQIYRRALAESDLPSVFDDIVQILTEILPKLDTVSAIQTLEELIATFRTNRSGSYFAVRGAWELMRSVWDTGFWNFVRDSSQVRDQFDRLQIAVSRGAESFGRLEESVRTAVATVFEKHVNYLQTHRPSFREVPRLERQDAKSETGE